jgi:hypothetical protein
MDAARRAALPVDSQSPGNGAGKGIRINLTDFPQWPIRLPPPEKGAPAWREPDGMTPAKPPNIATRLPTPSLFTKACRSVKRLCKVAFDPNPAIWRDLISSTFPRI